MVPTSLIVPQGVREVGHHLGAFPGHEGSANPQDLAVAPDGTLWVPRYNVPSVAVPLSMVVQGFQPRCIAALPGSRELRCSSPDRAGM